MALGTLPTDISVVKLRNILICFFLTIFFTNQLLRMKPVIKDFRNKDYYCIGPGIDGEDIKVGHWCRIKRESFLMVYSHYPTPRPIQKAIRNDLHGIVWRCSRCTETVTNTDSHWIYWSLSLSLSVTVGVNIPLFY